MSSDYQVDEVLRNCRQTVMKAMVDIRASMRGSKRLALSETVDNDDVAKSEQNLTKGVDREAESLIVASLQKKLLGKPTGINQLTVFSEELGISTFPAGADENESPLVVFIDPIDGTEFIASLQGGWCLLGVCDRETGEPVVAVAGDIFLNRVFWASKGGMAECLDQGTGSWFKLDGGPNPKSSLKGARINALTTKASRFRSLAGQTRLLDAIEEGDARINLSWGSNMICQVAAGYADVAIEFTKGFATYDVLPGLFIGQMAGLTIMNPRTRELLPQPLDIASIFATFRKDPSHPLRTPFVAAKDPALVEQVIDLLDL